MDFQVEGLQFHFYFCVAVFDFCCGDVDMFCKVICTVSLISQFLIIHKKTPFGVNIFRDKNSING